MSKTTVAPATATAKPDRYKRQLPLASFEQLEEQIYRTEGIKVTFRRSRWDVIHTEGYFVKRHQSIKKLGDLDLRIRAVVGEAEYVIITPDGRCIQSADAHGNQKLLVSKLRFVA